ncbi:MAG: hypothetical protein D6694_14745 [Gammaproteobacteria bacterium]|nr:MAG: hypothetical protein D6694_14745 [Gammaproteobacteria bacterium]
MRIIGILSVCVLLAACGFQLRGSQSPSLAGYQINVSSPEPFGQLTRSLIHRLRQLGAELTAHKAPEQLTIELGQLQRVQRTLSVDLNGRPIEYEYSLSVPVTVSRRQQVLVRQTFVVHRVLTWDHTRAVARDTEKAQTEQEMARELADSIAEMIRIHAPTVS